MDELTNRWRSPVVLDDSYWSKHRAAILQGFALAAVLLLSACVWIVLLRRQVLRRKLAERALSARLEFDRVLINGMPHPTYVRDRQARLLVCNKAYREVFGVEDERQFLGTTVMQACSPARSRPWNTTATTSPSWTPTNPCCVTGRSSCAAAKCSPSITGSCLFAAAKAVSTA